MNLTIDLSYVNKSGSDYAKFKAWVDAQCLVTDGNYDYLFSATDAAYMYRLDGAQKYATLAMQMVEKQVTDYEAAVAAGRVPAIASDSFYSVGSMIQDVSLVYDWCGSQLTATQKTRYSAYVEETLYNLYHPTAGHWGSKAYTWSGWALTDCANNYYYSHMLAVMTWALASGSATWMTKLRDATSTGTLDKLVAYFATIPHGGSEEGTGYGTSHMRVFLLLRIWRDCTGQDLHGPHVDGSLRYWTHAITPDVKFFAPIGDQSRVSEPALFDYQLSLIAAGCMLSNDAAARNGALYTLAHATPNWMQYAFDYRDGLMPHDGAAATAPTELYYDAAEVGALFNRAAWTADALWMATICGKYDQSHAHQEQGSITLRKGAGWITASANIWSHSGIHQDTPGHNVVRFERGGTVLAQSLNTTCTKAISGTDSAGNLTVTMNLSPAYNGVTWTRRVDFAAGGVRVEDTYAGSGVTGILQWHFKDEPAIVGNVATVAGAGVTITNGDGTPATLSKVNMKTTDADYGNTWRLEARGATQGFVTTFDISGNGAPPGGGGDGGGSGDGGGDTAPPPPSDLVADFRADVSGLRVDFYDQSGGTPTAWSWDMGVGGAPREERNPTVVYAAAGVYNVALTVTAGSETASVTKAVAVGDVEQPPANVGPVADFTFTTDGLTASFDDASTDSDGAIVSRAWDFGDGTTSAGASPIHSYATAGTYGVTLTVTDDGGLTSAKTKIVALSVIIDPPPPATSAKVSITRIGRWVVDGGTAHNEEKDALEEASNLALIHPGATVAIQPPAYAVVATTA
jgi:PKD repeat protein